MGRRDHGRSNTNPAALRIEWKGDISKGYFSFYDKEEKENVVIKQIRFIPLFERHAVGGYSEKHNTGLFSNEIDNLKTQEIVLSKFQNEKFVEITRGLYANLEGDRAICFGGSGYQKIVYVLILKAKGIESGTIAKITMAGSALGPWFDLTDDERKDTITVTEFTEHEKGKTEFRSPVFKIDATTDENEELAEAAFDKVEAYVKATGGSVAPRHQDDQESPDDDASQEEEPPADPPDADPEPGEFDDDIPF